MPATTTARMWYHPNGALSISAKASRRRSLGSTMWAKSLWKLWKAILPPDVFAAMVGGRSLVGAACWRGDRAWSLELGAWSLELGESKGRRQSTQQSSERAICKTRELSAH